MSGYKEIRYLKVEIRPTDVPMQGEFEFEIEVRGLGFSNVIRRQIVEKNEFRAMFDEYFDMAKEEIRRFVRDS